MRIVGPVLVALLLCGCATASRIPERSALTFAPLRFSPPEVREARLSGGARVFLLEDHDVPLVRVNLMFRGGHIHDPPEKAGLAQVTGLAWRTGGTAAESPEQFDDRLERAGMDLSLSLGRESGGASLSVLTGDLEQGLGMLSDLLLSPGVRQERVEWAVSQVAERALREADDPESLAFRELRRALYRGHPRGIIATPETVRRVTREDVQGFHRALVEDGFWTIGVTGDFRAEEVLRQLEERFGTLPGGGGAFPLQPPPPTPYAKVVLVPKALPQSTIVWSRLGPPRTSPEFYPLEIADHLFGSGGFQCILAREIRSDRGLAYSVGGFYDAQAKFGVLGAYASTKKESTGEVLTLLRTLLARTADEGFSEADVERAKETLGNRYVFRFQDPASLVREQMTLVLAGLPADLATQYLPQIQAQSSREVSAAVRTHYLPVPGVTVIVGDVDPEDPAWAGADVEVVRIR
jgi:zinc protease